jgi:hypothetical protein
MRSLVFSQNYGPYVGLGIDHNLILSVGAMPTRLICILVGFQLGPIGEISAEAAVVLAYYLAALGIWRSTKGLAVFATMFVVAESLLLALCLRYAISTTLLPEFRKFAVSSALGFLAVYSLSTIYLLRQNIKRILGNGPTSSVDGEFPTQRL